MNRTVGPVLLCTLLTLGGACPGPPPSDRPDECLREPMREVIEQWPTLQAALDARDVYGAGLWYYAHKRASLDGFGVTLATVTARPGIGSIIDLPEDVPAGRRADEPSLLFFDQDGEDESDWPLIGMGFFYDFDPCIRPKLDCADPSDFFVHEAGYHRLPIGDGGMDVAVEADLRADVPWESEGCELLEKADLRTRIGTFAHGRTWVTHVWFPPDGEDADPVWASEDPWMRWTDAADRAEIEGRPFYSQGVCDCPDESVPVQRTQRGGCF